MPRYHYEMKSSFSSNFDNFETRFWMEASTWDQSPSNYDTAGIYMLCVTNYVHKNGIRELLYSLVSMENGNRYYEPLKESAIKLQMEEDFRPLPPDFTLHFTNTKRKKPEDYTSIEIGNYDARIASDHLIAGCTRLSFDKVKEIYDTMVGLQQGEADPANPDNL